MIWAVAGVLAALVVFVSLNWYANAEARTISKGLKSIILVGLGLFALVVIGLVFTGRFGLLPLLLVIGPLALRIKRLSGHDSAGPFNRAPSSNAMSRAEAFEVLGLSEGATETEIKAAYKKLMGQIHPDKGGSDWMAAKLNEAKNMLLGK